MARLIPPALLVICAALAALFAAPAGAADLRRHGQPVAEPRTAEEALRLATRLQDGKGVETGFELTPVLKTLAEKLPQLEGADRRRAERMLARPVPGQANPGEDTYQPGIPVFRECSTNFCVHYVTQTDDAPPGGLNYVQTMLDEFEHVYGVINGQLQWRPPKPDAGRGGDDRTDVYIKNIGPNGIFGYSAPDPGQQGSQVAAFIVMDNDYQQSEYRNYSHFLAPLQVTAAHEYHHVIQFNYDLQQDNWMFEATAVWMEDRVYDDINDYRNYLPEWSRRSTQPLTQFNSGSQGDGNVKAYGDVVWNRWIDERLGPETIRRAWEVSVETRLPAGSFAPAAYDRALREKGQTFFGVFTQFAAETAEWRSASFFEEGPEFPADMQRAIASPVPPQNVSRERHDFVEGGLDHTAFALVPIDPSGESRITLGGTFRRGVAGAIALVGRTGGEVGGQATVRIKRLPRGGPGRVTLENASSFSRVSAVIINADVSQSGYSQQLGDWVWLGDGEPITLAVNDFTKAKLSRVRPRATSVSLAFSESVAGLSTSSVKLVGPNGRSVRTTIAQSQNGRTVVLRTSRRLSKGRRYTVKLSSAVTDPSGNRLPSSSRTKRFTAR